MEKTCSKCKLTKDTKLFYRDKGKKDGFNYSCKECIKRYNGKNKAVIARSFKAYREIHKDQLNNNNKIWRQNNSRTEYYKKYSATNKESIALRHKAYRGTNKDKIAVSNKQWIIKNRDNVNNRNQKRRASVSNTDNSYTVEQWTQCKEQFNNSCAYCGRELKLTREHFTPLLNGGEYTINNIIPVCSSCNSSKGAKDFFTWFPNQGFYSKQRENKILKYLGYNKETKIQQLALM